MLSEYILNKKWREGGIMVGIWVYDVISAMVFFVVLFVYCTFPDLVVVSAVYLKKSSVEHRNL